MDGDNRVFAIVLAAEHLLRLAGIHRGRQVVEAASQIVSDRLACFRPLDENGQIVGATAERFAEIAILFQAAPALQEFLRRGLILPEVRIRDAFFYRREFFGVARGVKDSSAGRMRGEPSPDTCEAVRRVEWP
jgi:hypothetical protein